MKVGVPKEIKTEEYRVGLTPDSVRQFVDHGHEVLVETNAGVGLNCSDEDYRKAGAEIINNPRNIFDEADLIIKVKEPQQIERKMLRENQILYTFLHLAPDPDQTADLIASGAICIAYETVTNDDNQLPLLTPMSQVAGRLSIQAGAKCLEKEAGGKGVLLGGVPGVLPAKVTVIGGGTVGENAIVMALGLGADVTVIDNNVETLAHLDQLYAPALKTAYSSQTSLEHHVINSDLVIGAVLVAGAEAPKLVSADMIKKMKKGSVLVDVAIDQGGCFETSRPTTHSDPTYVINGIVHYCVANMPGAVPCTSTYALNNVTTPFGISIANKGHKLALLEDPHLRNGLNVYKGHITNQAVANSLGYDYVEAVTILT
ncbi:MAG: alanine dehydrogenase [Pseudomonadota bacterium]|nr:alanine dehydrogenase [Pseudomonadota bacterium]